VVGAAGRSLVGQAIDGCPGEGDPATAFSKLERVGRLISERSQIAIEGAPGVCEAGFDALFEHPYAELQVTGHVRRIGVLDDVGADLADSRRELRAPGGVWRSRPDAIHFTPQVGEHLVEIV